MRLLWGRLGCRPVGSHGRGLGGLWLLSVLAGAALFGDSAALDAEEYSAYSDPEKPVLSVILSEERNVEELAKRFDLSDEEVENVLAAVRKENEALAQEYGESERIVASNRGLSDEEVARKIAASGYHEEVRSAVAATKGEVEAILPEDQSADLESWVDGQWSQEVKEASTEESAEVVRTKSGRRKLRCKVFATQYHGYTRYEAALPHRKLKFGNKPRVRIRRVNHSRVVRPRVKEVGPWNTYDNYWATRKHRTMWKKLRRCTPEAQAAYYNNFNNGRDEFGRKVLNPAGVDLTPRAARGLGLRKYQNAWVYVRFPWIRR
ncbi:MAG: hypothetical protein M3N18_03515 [Actinomycetota bacterium]|nr:hypothetical protein [Actinomycetota bacterium]